MEAMADTLAHPDAGEHARRTRCPGRPAARSTRPRPCWRLTAEAPGRARCGSGTAARPGWSPATPTSGPCSPTRGSASTSTCPGFPHMTRGRAAVAQDTPPLIINTDDPEHTRLRRMVNAPFTVKRVEAMRPADPEDRRRPDRRHAGRAEARSTWSGVRAAGAVAGDLPSCSACRTPTTSSSSSNSTPAISHDATPEEAQAARSRALVGYLDEPDRAEAGRPGRRPAVGAGRPDQGRRADPRRGRHDGRAAADRRARDHRQHDRPRHARPAARTPTSSRCCGTPTTRRWSPARSRSCCAT